LLQAGKAKKVALVACLHKLLNIINTMVRKNSLWQQNLSPQTSWLLRQSLSRPLAEGERLGGIIAFGLPPGFRQDSPDSLIKKSWWRNFFGPAAGIFLRGCFRRHKGEQTSFYPTGGI
jgi:hypothetical protein